MVSLRCESISARDGACIQRGETLIVTLGGGDKSTQSADIAKAVKLATTIEE
jgi:putative component of toxin-antitoxin plasmid stabilization module